jgi:hypothetical protein
MVRRKGISKEQVLARRKKRKSQLKIFSTWTLRRYRTGN